MVIEGLVIGGIVKNGVILPEGDAELPEGARVQIIVSAGEIPCARDHRVRPRPLAGGVVLPGKQLRISEKR